MHALNSGTATTAFPSDARFSDPKAVTISSIVNARQSVVFSISCRYVGVSVAKRRAS